jgi:tRNA (guanine37-N1)-methyltransferase
MLDSIIRLLPGVMGKVESGLQESFSVQSGGLLEHPHYTRPQVWEGMEIPEVVTSGDHEKLDKWRRQRALAMTQERRPDLLEDLPQNDSAPKK